MKNRTLKTRGLALCAGLAATALISVAPAQARHSVRVAQDYFSVSYPLMLPDPASVRSRELQSIHKAGFKSIHQTLTWSALEATPPDGSGHHYNFTQSDLLVGAAAKHRLRIDAMFGYTPAWDSAATGADAITCNLFPSVSNAPKHVGYYALAAHAMAARYGPGGSFWHDNPGLPEEPITRWEIWNEPNLVGYWCPEPDPQSYAELYVQAANQIRSVDHTAKLIMGDVPLGSPSGNLMDPKTFFKGVLDQRPKILKKVNAIGIHPYPHEKLDSQLKTVATFRSVLKQIGVPKTVPMLASEIGWASHGPNPLTDVERAQRFRSVTKQLPRSTCNISGMVAYAWTTPEENPNYDQDWFGIANPTTGALYAPARAFTKSVKVELGKGTNEAPYKLIRACKGMPKPDGDGDGVADNREYFPTDAARAVGPLSWGGYRKEVRKCKKSLPHHARTNKVRKCVEKRLHRH